MIAKNWYKDSLEGMTGTIGINVAFEVCGQTGDPESIEHSKVYEEFINRPDIKEHLIRLLLNEVCDLMNKEKHQ